MASPEPGPGGGASTGDVYTWATKGVGEPVPQLIEACRGKQVAALAGGYGHAAVIFRGEPPYCESLPLDALSELGELRQLAFGKDHVVALTLQGDVFTLGKGGWGQLGHGSMRDSLVPLHVQKLDGRNVAQVACGAMHSVARTADGGVYTWGRGFEGQLGHGDGLHEAQLAPRYVAALHGVRILSVSAGAMHTAALTVDGAVYCWGEGTSGQLGVGKLTTKASRPVRVSSLPPVASLSCGHMHTAAVDSAGALHCWGLGTHGQLGFRPDVPNARFATQPFLVGGVLEGTRLVSVECAGNATSALDDDGLVWVLGNGRSEPTPLPALRRGGRTSALLSNGLSTLGFVETSVSHTVPACAALDGGTDLAVYGPGFFESEVVTVRFALRGDDGSAPPAPVDVDGYYDVTYSERAGAAQSGEEEEESDVIRVIRATVPPLPREGETAVSVSFDGGATFVESAAAFHSVRQPRFGRCEPSLVPLGGGKSGGVLMIPEEGEPAVYRSAEVTAKLVTPLPAPAPAADAAAAPVAGGADVLSLEEPTPPAQPPTVETPLSVSFDEEAGTYFVDLRTLSAPTHGKLAIAVDGQIFTPPSAEIVVYSPPSVLGMKPVAGPLTGATTVTLELDSYVDTDGASVQLVQLPGVQVGFGVRPPATAPAAAPAAPAAAEEGAPGAAAAPASAPAPAPAPAAAPARPASAAPGGAADGSSGEPPLAAAPAPAAEPLTVTIGARVVRGAEGRPGLALFDVPPDSLGETPAVFAVHLALNGEDYNDTGRVYSAHDELRVRGLSPGFGEPAGGTVVKVLGGPFWETSGIAAKVHHGATQLVVPGAFNADDGSIEFVAPAWDVDADGDSPIVEVSLNGYNWTNWCMHFEYGSFVFSGFEPEKGPIGATLKLRGEGLRASEHVAVRFSVSRAETEEELTAVVPGRFDEAEGCVLCEAPPFEGAQGPLMAKVELALNGQQFAALPAGGAEFKYELPKGSKKK